MSNTFTYWADSLSRVHALTAGCYLAGVEGSDDPKDGIPFTGEFVVDFDAGCPEYPAVGRIERPAC